MVFPLLRSVSSQSQHGADLQRIPPYHPISSSIMLTLYQDAIAALNTLQSNFSVVDAIRKSGKAMNQQAIPEMIEWCQKLGYEVCASALQSVRELF